VRVMFLSPALRLLQLPRRNQSRSTGDVGHSQHAVQVMMSPAVTVQ